MLRVIEKTHGQDYDDLVKECKLEDTLFEDDFFNNDSGALARILVDSGIIANEQAIRIEWLRPHEICQRRYWAGLDEEKNIPRMYAEGISRFDVNQGLLGDCYFLTALSQLADDKWAFARVVPPKQTFDRSEGYVGIFRFRFYKFGKWKEIVIDDRLPTVPMTGRLLFAECELKYDFWTSLVEKAYAKFRGSYSEIVGGVSADAAVSLTGGIPYQYYFAFGSTAQRPPNLIQFHQDHTMIFANIHGGNVIRGGDVAKEKYYQSLGLPVQHAYSVTGLLKVKGTYIIRLRNPHGYEGTEWKGEWSDKSSKWFDENKPIYTHPDKRDGEFFMSYRDFIDHFNSLELVFMKPSKSRFDLFEWTGSYIAPFYIPIKGNNTITFSLYKPDRKNHQKKKCSVIVSLSHKYEIKKKQFDDQFRIFKWGTTQYKWIQIAINEKLAGSTFNVSSRMELEEGDYTIIPFHYKSVHNKEHMHVKAGKKEEFHLRLFIETNWGSTDVWHKKVKLSISAHLPKPNNLFIGLLKYISNPKLFAYLIIKEGKRSDILYQSEAKESEAKETNSNIDWEHYEKHEWEPFNITFQDLLSKCQFEVYQSRSFSPLILKDTLIGQFEASLDDLILHEQFTLKDSNGNESGMISIESLEKSSVKQILGDESSPTRFAHYIIN